jgi:hypothetical protein
MTTICWHTTPASSKEKVCIEIPFHLAVPDFSESVVNLNHVESRPECFYIWNAGIGRHGERSYLHSCEVPQNMAITTVKERKSILTQCKTMFLHTIRTRREGVFFFFLRIILKYKGSQASIHGHIPFQGTYINYLYLKTYNLFVKIQALNG